MGNVRDLDPGFPRGREGWEDRDGGESETEEFGEVEFVLDCSAVFRTAVYLCALLDRICGPLLCQNHFQIRKVGIQRDREEQPGWAAATASWRAMKDGEVTIRRIEEEKKTNGVE